MVVPLLIVGSTLDWVGNPTVEFDDQPEVGVEHVVVDRATRAKMLELTLSVGQPVRSFDVTQVAEFQQ